jgi:hypothetical protein
MVVVQLRGIILLGVQQGGMSMLLEGVMHRDRMSNNTIIYIKPLSTKNLVLLSTDRTCAADQEPFS